MTVPFHRVILVGFMGSGKTRVGQALARRLGWSFRDFDQEVRARVGLPIPEIFRQHGEEFFRAAEAEVGAVLLREKNVVLATGGGWPVAVGRLEALGTATLSVWLRVSPEVALSRASKEGPTRPLLAVPDPLSTARSLLERREPFYAMAQVVLDSDHMDPERLAQEIQDLMINRGQDLVRPLPRTS